MIKKLGIEESKVPDMCASLYKYYGTTMAGLRVITPELDAFFLPDFLIQSDFTKRFIFYIYVMFFRLLGTNLTTMTSIGTDFFL